MNKHYTYRWLYGCAVLMLIVMLGFYYVIQPEQREMYKLEMHARQLQQHIAQAKTIKQVRVTGKHIYAYQYADALSMLFLAAHKAHAVIERLHVQDVRLDHDSVLLVAKGSFASVANFIAALQRQPIFMFVTNFSWRLLNADNLEITMMIQMIKNSEARPAQNQVVFDNSQSAFCAADLAEQRNRDEAALAQTVPLEWLRMVGYLQQDKRREAWLELPNNGLISVAKADQIGREHGIVTQITPERIVVTTRTGIQIIRSD